MRHRDREDEAKESKIHRPKARESWGGRRRRGKQAAAPPLAQAAIKQQRRPPRLQAAAGGDVVMPRQPLSGAGKAPRDYACRCVDRQGERQAVRARAVTRRPEGRRHGREGGGGANRRERAFSG